MACKSNLVFLSCAYSGVGFTSKGVSDDATRIQLMRGHGANFPPVTNGTHFYVTVEGCDSCCETMRVVGREGDVLVVERGLSNACTCIKSNAKVSYNAKCKEFFEDINNVIPLNVQSPLSFDCDTNTLSVDCAALFKTGCGGGCDCGDGGCDGCHDSTSDAGTSNGLRGPKGDKGEPGPLPTAVNVSPLGVLTFSYPDGTTIQATGKVPKGPKGDKGDNGETGKQGDVGASGENAAGIAHAEVDGQALVFTLSDDNKVRVENAIPEPVPGERGEKGDKGDKGDAATYMVKAGDTWYVYATPNLTIRVNVAGADMSITTGDDGLGTVDLRAFPANTLVRLYNGQSLLGVGVV